METEKIEQQKEKLRTLLELIEQNPDLRILPMVESQVVAEDGYSWWSAEWGNARIEEVYGTDERVYIRSDDEEELVEELTWNEAFIIGLSETEAIKKAEEIVANYKWEKVIAVAITI